jgi:hypothetical protein
VTESLEEKWPGGSWWAIKRRRSPVDKLPTYTIITMHNYILNVENIGMYIISFNIIINSMN